VKDRHAWRILTAAIVPIFLLGSILHFAYDWSGDWRPVALVGAVNESVWEHLKIAYWPALLSGLLEWRMLKRRYPGFWAARSLGLLVMPVVIAMVFYGYTALLGGHWLVADIGTFLLGIAAGQWACYGLLEWRPGRVGRIVTGLLFAALLAAFACLTYWPLEIGLFREMSTGLYGIP
jgi:hypothetical protein